MTFTSDKVGLQAKEMNKMTEVIIHSAGGMAANTNVPRDTGPEALKARKPAGEHGDPGRSTPVMPCFQR